VSIAVPEQPSAVPFPARLALVSLLPILGLLPPETRGEALAGAALLVALLTLLLWPAVSRRSLAPSAVVIGLVLAAVSARAGAAPATAIEPVALVVLATAAGIAAATAASDRRFASLVPGIAAAVGGAAAAHGIYQKLWGLERVATIVTADPTIPDAPAMLHKLEAGRAFAGFATPAALGGFLALTLPLAVAFAAGTRGARRALWIAAAAVQLGGLAATASVTAAGSLAAASLLAFLLWRGSRVVLLAGLGTLLVLLAAVAMQRGAPLDPRDPQGPWRQRTANWRAAWEVARDNPWLGVGPGAYAEAILAHRRPGDNEARHAHNLPLEIAAEVGWPAAVLGSGVFFALFLGPLWQARDDSVGPGRRAAAIGLASFALHNLADFTFAMPSILWTAAILRGIVARRSTMGGGLGLLPPHRGFVDATALAAVIVLAVTAALGGVAREFRREARAAAHLNEDGRALALAARAVSLAPWDIDAAVAFAAATLGRGEPSRIPEETQSPALEPAERAVRLAPTRASARDLRARARLAVGDQAGALADWEQAARLDPGRPEYARARDGVRRALVGVR